MCVCVLLVFFLLFFCLQFSKNSFIPSLFAILFFFLSAILFYHCQQFLLLYLYLQCCYFFCPNLLYSRQISLTPCVHCASLQRAFSMRTHKGTRRSGELKPDAFGHTIQSFFALPFAPGLLFAAGPPLENMAVSFGAGKCLILTLLNLRVAAFLWFS